jgi:hypothetical protein
VIIRGAPRGTGEVGVATLGATPTEVRAPTNRWACKGVTYCWTAPSLAGPPMRRFAGVW